MKKKARLRLLLVLSILFVFALSIRAETTFISNLDGLQETPPNASNAAGVGSVILNEAETQVTITLYFQGLSSSQTAAHIHSPAPRGVSAAVIQPLPNGNFTQTFPISAAEVVNLKAGLWYFNVHNANFPGGEIRGQIKPISNVDAVAMPFSNGSLDAAFNSGGVVTSKIDTGSVAQAVAVQKDGKIIVAGFSNRPGDTDFAMFRYNPDGTLDATFGNGGKVKTPVGESFDNAFAVAIQPDGKIVAAGRSYNGVNMDFAIVRYNSDGTLDQTFDGNSGNGNGIVKTVVGSGDEVFRGVEIQTDGKILAVGDSFDGGNTSITVVRYNADGTLDTTFDGDAGNGNGILVTRIGNGAEHAYQVKNQSDGKIVVAGYFSAGTGNNDVALLRYNTNGTLDTTFNDDGIATTAIGTRTDEAFDLALQNDGKIVVAGCINSGQGNDFLAIRYNLDGSLDNTFGTNGATVTPIGNAAEIANGIVIQPDGKIISGGFSNNGSRNVFALVRQNSDGSLDQTFGIGGKVTTAVGAVFDVINGIALQADGKIIAVGRVVDASGDTTSAGVVRYGYGTNSATNDGYFNVNQNTAIRFENAFQAGNTSANSLTALALPPLPAGLNLLTTPQILQTSAKFSGDVFIKINLPENITEASFNAARILQFENGSWTDKTIDTPPRDFATRTIYARVSMLSPIAAVTSLTTTAANVSISGRVLSANGRYASGALVFYIDETGQTRYAVANPFGYFRFKNVKTGEPFVFRVRSKRFMFASQIASVNENFGTLNFTSD